MDRTPSIRYLCRQSRSPILPFKGGLSRCRHLSTYYNTHRTNLSPQRPYRTPQKPPFRTPYPPKRTFLSSFIPQPNNGNENEHPNRRTLTASRTLPYPPPPLFRVISSVESYAEFLPFLTASTVTARDPVTNYPTRAYLTVGYGPLSETFTSKVDCLPEEGVVEARSGEKFDIASDANSGGGRTTHAKSGLGALGAFAGFPGADEGIFEYLSTRWELVPEAEAGLGSGGQARTTVKLEIRFEFKNQLYAKMMGAVEGEMAGIMIEAFERRIREVHG
ncbi:ubiquinone-binding COQ10-like protein [Aspergillus lucknowensis]|uniref:Dehydrase and lipid transport-domain-containing protein n=1 Tax=Aspergillus lucknowensis TaxID=176173 RepID=A0ABR4LGA9_9EURO